MIGGMKKVGGNGRTPRKPTQTVFVHHKAHMAREGFKLTTTSARGERSNHSSTADPNLPLSHGHYDEQRTLGVVTAGIIKFAGREIRTGS